MAAAWERLVEAGLDVRAIHSTPWMPFEPGKCLVNSKDWARDCVPIRSSVFRPDLTVLAAETLSIPTLDFSAYFCDADHCPVILGGVLVYRDSHHMTATFARTLSRAMEEKLLLKLRP
jgi:hypothetical protein